MNEYFLHFAWKNLLFDQARLKTVSGQLLEVIDPGEYNRDSGPDFLNARVRIGDTLWAGNVEIHYRSSMWYDHSHHRNEAYDSVILHAVIIHDREVMTASGSIPETMEMNISRTLLDRYRSYMEGYRLVACSDDLHLLDPFFIRHRLHALMISRLERKSAAVRILLDESGNDWEETVYRMISGHFGMKVNHDPFMELSMRTPLKLLRKHADNLLQVEALLFGQAGMLEEGIFTGLSGDHYYNLLRREYKVLRHKYSLSPMESYRWRYHRMRPANFPTIRISQLAAVVARQPGLFAAFREAGGWREQSAILHAASSPYWHSRYNFGAESGRVPSETGSVLINNIIINSIVPLLFVYGKERGGGSYCDRAIDILDSGPPESNRITREWQKSGVAPSSAFESQALLELSRLCKNKECLNCHIGTKLISLGKDPANHGGLRLGEPEGN